MTIEQRIVAALEAEIIGYKNPGMALPPLSDRERDYNRAIATAINIVRRECRVTEDETERLTNSIDKLIFRRLASLTASEDNAKERDILGAQAREELKAALSAVISLRQEATGDAVGGEEP